jgi:hypothetical protein
MTDFFTPVVLGLHLLSVHVPAHEGQNDYNLGAYAKNADGYLIGAYRNTLDRVSVYAGREFTYGSWSADLVVMYGYQRKTRSCSDYVGCYHYTGSTPGALAPAGAVSYHFGEISGVSPVLTFMPGIRGANVLHFSIEKSL